MNRKIVAATLATLIVGVSSAGSFALAEEVVVAKADDIALLTKVKADLLQSGRVDGLEVNVDVKDGNVTLSGKASNEAERTTAAQIARGVSGVKSVENKLVLKAR